MRDFELRKRQILERVDILDVVSEHVKLKRSGQRWVGLCPFHTEKTPSFTVRPEHSSFKCFGCGKGGDLFSFVQFRENVSFVEAMRILADRAGVELEDSRGGEPTGPGRADLAKVNAWAKGFFRGRLLDEKLGRSVRDYLDQRRISEKSAEDFSLGLAIDGGSGLREAARRAGFGPALLLAADLLRQGDQGRMYDTFRNRLMFPIHEPGGRVIGFGGRTLVDDRAKYLNTSQNILFDKGRNLYGVERARDAIVKQKRVVVVEGYTDCLAAHQAGFTETVATLGTALTEAQVNLVRRYCEEIILLFDSDKAGEAAAERAIRIALPRCIAVRLAHLPEGKDPSDFLETAGSEAFSDLLKAAVDALEFKWVQTRARFLGDASNAGQHEAVLDFLRVVAEAVDTQAVDAIQRGLLVNQVAHLMRMDRSEVHHLMARLGPKSGGRSPAVVKRHSNPKRTEAPDPEQAAWTRVLEVLLNSAGALKKIGDVPDLGRIVDEQDRRIATILFGLGNQPGEFDVEDVLARCHEPEDAERVTELARRGAELGCDAAALDSAFERIGRASADSEWEETKQRLLGGEPGSELGADTADIREMVRDKVEKHRHFAPRRLIRRSIDARSVDSGNQTTSVEQS